MSSNKLPTREDYDFLLQQILAMKKRLGGFATGGGGVGASGLSGYSGYSGYSGRSGYSGYSGYSGSGISGYSGYSGYSGAAGTSGSSGTSIAISAENIFEFDDFGADSKFSYTVGSAPSRIASEANHPGIIQVASTGGNTINVAAIANATFYTPDLWRLTFVVRPNGHANAAYYVGAYSSVAFNPTESIWVRALTTDTNWQLVTRSASTETVVDTGIAITNATWYRITIYRKDASTIAATVNAGSEVTSTTNIPTAAMMIMTGLNVSSGTQTYDWDFWSFEDVAARY